MPDVSGTVDVEKGLINGLYKYVFSMTKASCTEDEAISFLCKGLVKKSGGKVLNEFSPHWVHEFCVRWIPALPASCQTVPQDPSRSVKVFIREHCPGAQRGGLMPCGRSAVLARCRLCAVSVPPEAACQSCGCQPCLDGSGACVGVALSASGSWWRWRVSPRVFLQCVCGQSSSCWDARD